MKVEYSDNITSEYLVTAGAFICGAKAKSTGMPCRINEIYANGRCRYHGGLSTGPKSKEGKKCSSLNGFKKKA